jgi:uridylate kinase
MKTYRRILLKISGEALSSKKNSIDPQVTQKVSQIVSSVLAQNIEIGIVVGGGNLYRGAALQESGMNRVVGDHIGMLATAMNALALNDTFRRNSINSMVMSGFEIGGGVCQNFNHNQAKENLSNKKVLIFCAGTGNPCFTTDTGAVLRGIEIEADIIFKATKVDGVYTDDPIKNPKATKYTSLSFDEAIKNDLKIMDTAAFALCKEHNIDICVFSMLEDEGTLSKILQGQELGTIVRN